MSSNFPEEITHLKMVKEKLHDTLVKLEEKVAGYEEEYIESKRYIAGSWSEMDPMERFSNERSITQIEHAGNSAIKMRTKMEKLIDAPYFARMDFRYDGEDEAGQFYIGKFSFDDNNQMLIYDWRAPISGMYYDFELGRASYEAPVGSIEGDIIRKRQFKIKDGRMEYVLESAINIDDDVLQRELSHTSDEKMKSIIATIQKEQNQIIRNDQANVLIIQGVAGSGKTSIALHRVAYLLYRYKERLSANHVVIISPNKVFADYISNVLPELGEEPIMEVCFEDLAADELAGVLDYEGFADQMEPPASGWAERTLFKSGLSFITLADEYLAYADKAYFQPQECVFGNFIIPKDFIQGRYDAYKNRPIGERFAEITDDILNRIKTDNIQGHKIPTQNEVMKKLTAMFNVKNTLALYADFYTHINRPEMFVLVDKNKLEWADVFPYLYFKLFTEGVSKFQGIQHMVIDEMQDYTPIQYAVINRMFRCKKTILGDFGQSLNPYSLHTPSVFKDIFDQVEIVELNKSYRSTYEIIEFSKKIQRDQKIEPIERHGDEPDLISCNNRQSEWTVIKGKAASFQEGEYATLGILCKDLRQANALHQELSKEFHIHLLDAGSSRFAKGITITTIAMSKGLEFDEVIIPSANTETYHSAHDRSLLYVACTRAMHRLALTYHGEITELIAAGKPENH